MSACAHCRAPGADNEWTLWACADGRKKRVRKLCDPCDVELNRTVLFFFNDPAAAEKVARYAAIEVAQ